MTLQDIFYLTVIICLLPTVLKLLGNVILCMVYLAGLILFTANKIRKKYFIADPKLYDLTLDAHQVNYRRISYSDINLGHLSILISSHKEYPFRVGDYLILYSDENSKQYFKIKKIYTPASAHKNKDPKSLHFYNVELIFTPQKHLDELCEAKQA